MRLTRLSTRFPIPAGPRTYATINPPIPSSPPSPAPLVTQGDFDGYLGILQSHGWHFHQASRKFEDVGATGIWWELRNHGLFPSFKASMAYVNDVADLAKKDKHHPTILVFDRVHVAISLVTHDTVERPATKSRDLGARTHYGRWPGITLRDIRMAMMINPLLEHHKLVKSILPEDQPIPSYQDLIDVHLTE